MYVARRPVSFKTHRRYSKTGSSCLVVGGCGVAWSLYVLPCYLHYYYTNHRYSRDVRNKTLFVLGLLPFPSGRGKGKGRVRARTGTQNITHWGEV